MNRIALYVFDYLKRTNFKRVSCSWIGLLWSWCMLLHAACDSNSGKMTCFLSWYTILFICDYTLKWYWNVSLHFTSFKQVKTFLVIFRITFLHPIITCRELTRASLSLLALEWHSYLRVRFKLRNGVSGLNNILSLLIHYKGRGNYCLTGIAVPGTCPTYCMKIMCCFLFYSDCTVTWHQ